MKTAKSMLAKLKSLYQGDQGQSVANLLKQAIQSKWHEKSESLDQYILRMQAIYDKLAVAGETLSKRMQVILIIQCLHNSVLFLGHIRSIRKGWII